MYNPILKKIFQLFAGSLGCSLTVLLSAPLLTRLYNPDIFGIYLFWVSVIAVISSISCLRYDAAIVVCKEHEANNLLNICILFSSIIHTFSFFVCAYLLKSVLKPHLVLSNYQLFSIFLCSFILSINNALTTLRLRLEHYSAVSIAKLVSTLFMFGSQILFFDFNLNGLIIGNIIFQTTNLLLLVCKVWNEIKILGLVVLKECIQKYKRFPIFTTTENLIGICGSESPSIIFGNIFTSNMFGQYSFASRTLQSPIGSITSILSQIILTEGGKEPSNTNLKQITNQILEILIRSSTIPLIIFFLYIPTIFEKAFGSSWDQASYIARLLYPWLICVLFVSPFTGIFVIKQKQIQGLIFQFIFLALRAICIFFSLKFLSPNNCIFAFSLCSCFVWFCFFFWYFHVIGFAASDIYRLIQISIWNIFPCAVLIFPIGKESYIHIKLAILLVIYLNQIKIIYNKKRETSFLN